jgi:serine/threonine protein kinase
MDAAMLNQMLARLDRADLSPEAFLEWLDEVLASRTDGRAWLREHWPVDRLPIIGAYHCIDRIGEGASGVVYAAVDLDRHPRLVALKLLRFIADEDKRRFFEREVEILKALDLPHVARYLASGSFRGTAYLAMEWARGLPLDEFLATRTAQLADKLAIFEKVAAAVAELHAAGVIHRDLKPRHIIVDDTGEVCIVDLGLSAVRAGDWATQIRRTQTRLGRIIGTLKYMSPEQAWGGLYRTDHRADIWALGVMLFEIATHGDYPYSLEPREGLSPADALLHRIQHDAPRAPQIRDRGVAADLATLISRCLAHEPRRRLASAAELADDLARIRARQRINTRPLPFNYRVQRIAIGLALHARTALWSLIVLCTTVALFGWIFVGNIHWVTQGDAYSIETRERLIKAAHPHESIPIRVVGIGDETISVVPPLATSLGFANVNRDIRTWRGVHGELMRRLAEAQPLLVVWDYYFRSPREEDAEFAAGVRALADAGTPVVVAVRRLQADGTPDLSSQLLEPLRDTWHHGLIIAHDMVAAPGEYVVALRRQERVTPALILAAFGALCYPDSISEVRWPDRKRDLQMRYRIRGTDEYRKAIDDIEVHARRRVLSDDGIAHRDDLLAISAFPLTSLDTWRARTLNYEALLGADPQELRRLVHRKVLVIADTRGPAFFLVPRDLHRVRFDEGVVDDVPGGYLLANGIEGLLSNRQKVARLPLIAQSFSVVVGMAVVGCLLAVLVGRRLFRRRRTRAKRIGSLLFCAGGLAGCVYAVSAGRSSLAVQTALAGCALLLALGPALAIESVRRRRQVPESDDSAPASGSW